jgi:hypothetical protein
MFIYPVSIPNIGRDLLKLMASQIELQILLMMKCTLSIVSLRVWVNLGSYTCDYWDYYSMSKLDQVLSNAMSHKLYQRY